MKAGNLVLGLVGLIFAGFGWMLLDSGSSKSSPASTGSATLNLAIASGQPVLLEFYADWCGPCKMVAPELEALSKEWTGKAKIVRVNVDQQKALAQQYGVNGIPAFVVLRKGKEVNRAVGGMPRDEIRKLVF
jgi:thioredoxin 1